MSSVGRSMLIKSCLSNLPMYDMIMYLLPLSTIENMDTARRISGLVERYNRHINYV
jgi:hypothetical protein